MQIATITITVQSEGERFMAESNDISEKAAAKLATGEYTCDISDVTFESIASPNPA